MISNAFDNYTFSFANGVLLYWPEDNQADDTPLLWGQRFKQHIFGYENEVRKKPRSSDGRAKD